MHEDLTDGQRNSALAQQALDEGHEYTFDPAKSYHIPLFAHRDKRVSGGVTAEGGPALYLAYSRGWVPAAAFRDDGFELRDRVLWLTRDEWSNGPPGQPPDRRWASVRKMRWHFTFTKLDGTDWEQVGIVGMSGWTGSTGPGDPQPYHILCHTGQLWLVTRWTDGVVRRFSVPIPPGTTTLDVVLEADWAANTVACSLGSVTAHDGWPPAEARLTENNTFGCGVGQIAPTPGSVGHTYGGRWPNMVFHRMNVVWNDDVTNPLVLYPQRGIVPTYDYAAGHVLPLVLAGPGGYAQVICKGQLEPHEYGGNLLVEDLTIIGRPDACPVVHHGMLNGVSFYRCDIRGGPSQVASATGSVAYPFKMRDCTFTHANISNLFLSRLWSAELTGCSFKYGKESAAHLFGCDTTVDNCVNAPPGVDQRAAVIQHGGRGDYFKLQDDVEWTPDPRYRLVEVIGHNVHENEWWPTYAELTRCSYDARYDTVRLSEQLVRGYDVPGYRGQFRIVVDGQTLLAHRLLEEWGG
jgi:hypothetical protein